jgi:hypothetical protein
MHWNKEGSGLGGAVMFTLMGMRDPCLDRQC